MGPNLDLPKRLLIIKVLGFRTLKYSKISAWLLLSMVQLTRRLLNTKIVVFVISIGILDVQNLQKLSILTNLDIQIHIPQWLLTWLLPSGSQSAAFYLWWTFISRNYQLFFCLSPDTWERRRNAHNIDISHYSNSYFNIACFTPPAKCSRNSFFLLGGLINNSSILGEVKRTKLSLFRPPHCRFQRFFSFPL